MMKHLILFGILICINLSHSQSIKVLDEATHEPVPYATVLLLEKGAVVSGDYASEDGTVIIDAKPFDTIEFSCIGYNPKSVGKDEMAAGIIYLSQAAYQLKEVVVTGTNSKSADAGFTKGKGKYLIVAKQGAEVVLFIDNVDGHPKTIKSFVFKAATPKKYKTAFRIHFYKKDTATGAPGNEVPQ